MKQDSAESRLAQFLSVIWRTDGWRTLLRFILCSGDCDTTIEIAPGSLNGDGERLCRCKVGYIDRLGRLCRLPYV